MAANPRQIQILNLLHQLGHHFEISPLDMIDPDIVDMVDVQGYARIHQINVSSLITLELGSTVLGGAEIGEACPDWEPVLLPL